MAMQRLDGALWQGLGYLIVGVGACLYSPAKYGILPEIVQQERLVKANGAVEFLTLVAILTGNIGGAPMIDVLSVTTCYDGAGDLRGDRSERLHGDDACPSRDPGSPQRGRVFQQLRGVCWRIRGCFGCCAARVCSGFAGRS